MHVFTRIGQVMPKNIYFRNTEIEDTGGSASHCRKNHVFGSRAGLRVSGAPSHGDIPHNSLSITILNNSKRLIPSLLLFAALTMHTASAHGHPSDTSNIGIQPLQIGDPIPDEIWNISLQVVNHPEGKETIRLADYRGKLIILDFWATWCSSCIAAMPRIHELERERAADMAIIPITYEPADKVFPFLTKNKTVQPLVLFSVVGDEAIRTSFPHQVVPHYVWIDPRGKIVATTGSDDVSTDNIAKVLDGDAPDFALKTKIDTDKPLMFDLDALPKAAEIQHYFIFIKGEMPSLNSSAKLRYNLDGTANGIAILNRSLLSIYTTIAWQIFGENPVKRIDLIDAITDSSVYTFDFIMPGVPSDSVFLHLLTDLNQHTGYSAQLAKRKRQCLVLTKIGDGSSFTSTSQEKIQIRDSLIFNIRRYPITTLIGFLNGKSISDTMPVLNETGYEGVVDIVINAPFDDIDNIRKQLNRQGLELSAVEREIELLEIRKSRNHVLITKN